ncbi:MAG: flippase [Prochloraceae cyanobacterium]|nr:flippase [Prochloraceae cyanobacterium]
MNISQGVKTKIASYYKRLMGQGNVAVLMRGAGSSFTVKILGIGLGFGVQAVAARLLGVESYGNYAYVLAWTNILALLGKIGFDTVSVRFVATYYSQQEWGLLRGFLRYSSAIILISSTSVAVCLGFGAWLLRENLSRELLHTFWVASVMLPVISTLKIQESRLQALRRIFQAQFPQAVLRPLIILIGLITLTLWAENVNSSSFMSLNLVATAIALGTISFVWKKTIPGEIKLVKASYKSKEWLRIGQAMILIAGFQVVLSQSDVAMIGTFVGTKETALYAVAARIAGLLIFILIGVNSVLGPLVASLYAQKSHVELQRIVNLGVNFVFFSTLLIAIVLTLWGKIILNLFGEEFSSSYPILVILLLGQLVNAMAGPVGLLLAMTGHHEDASRILGISAIVNLILNALLIPNCGALGAAVATAISTALWNVIMSVLVWQRIKIISVAVPKFIISSRI